MQANTFDVLSKRKECVYKTHMSPRIGAGGHARKMKVISVGTGVRNNALKLLERNGLDTTRWRT